MQTLCEKKSGRTEAEFYMARKSGLAVEEAVDGITRTTHISFRCSQGMASASRCPCGAVQSKRADSKVFEKSIEQSDLAGAVISRD